MIVTIDYGHDVAPERIEGVQSIRTISRPSCDEILITYFAGSGKELHIKGRHIRYNEYVTITIH